jgi:hypothetical protein
MDLEAIKNRLLRARQISPSGCWEWSEGLTNQGYGRVRLQEAGDERLVHRLAAAKWLGFDVESEVFILHRCDNRKCFNPEHLFEGDAADNIHDCMAKGRFRIGNRGVHERTKTHCPQGHEYTLENTYLKYGSRNCKLCRQSRTKEWFVRNREVYNLRRRQRYHQRREAA